MICNGFRHHSPHAFSHYVHTHEGVDDLHAIPKAYPSKLLGRVGDKVALSTHNYTEARIVSD